MEYLAFDAILQSGESEQEALDYARGMVWGDCEATLQNIGYARHIETVAGNIGVYYDYGADYYFFTDESGE